MKKWPALAFIAGCATNAPAPAPHLQTPPPNIFVNDVYPILRQTCVSNTGGCHGAEPELGLVLEPDVTTAYRSALLYTGDFTADAPLLTSHANSGIPGSNDVSLTPDATAEIEAWLAQEREDRGL